MDEFLNWDELRRELIAILAGVVYLAAVRLIQRYKGAIDRWLKPSDEVPLPTPEPSREEPAAPSAPNTPDMWHDPPATDPPSPTDR